MTDLCSLSITEIVRAFSRRQFSSRELTEAYINRIEDLNGKLNCYLAQLPHLALEQADAADKRWQSHETYGPMDGIPIALKDNMDIAGLVTTNGLAPQDQQQPAERDAQVVARLRHGGAIFLGKTSMDEGALGISNNNPHFGRTLNPWNLEHTPGGSSGGSAAAVAGWMAAGALGTDTLGSLRIPAAYCGICALKPTLGLVHVGGVKPLSWNLDHIGPMARKAADLAVMLDVMAAPDGDGMGQIGRPPGVSYLPDPKPESLDGVQVGRVSNLDETIDDDIVKATLQHGVDAFEAGGADVYEIEVPELVLDACRRAGLLVIEAQAAVLHAKARQQHPEIYTPDFCRMLDFGAQVTGLKLAEALLAIRNAGRAFRRLFDAFDVVITATTPQTAFAFDGAVPETVANLTAPANFAGCPALNLPFGLSLEGMPIGLQLISGPSEDAKLLSIAAALETHCNTAFVPPFCQPLEEEALSC